MHPVLPCMIVRTAACSVDWQDRQAVEDGTLVARDLAQKHEPVSLLSDESRDQVFKGWPLLAAVWTRA